MIENSIKTLNMMDACRESFVTEPEVFNSFKFATQHPIRISNIKYFLPFETVSDDSFDLISTSAKV